VKERKEGGKKGEEGKLREGEKEEREHREGGRLSFLFLLDFY